MEFEKRKAATMASLGCTETDKSPKGSLDAPIIPLLTAINSHPCFFTTSSCSGRISILSQPSSPAPAEKKKARGGTWLYISHSPADPDSILSLLFPPVPAQPPCDLVFRFEPLILAIECRDLDSAQFLVSTAISCGFRESGITSANGRRVIVAVRCSIRLEVPLGRSNDIAVSREYVRFLIEVANEKMEANRRRTDGFLQTLLQKNGFGDTPVKLVNGTGDGESLEYIEDLGKDAPLDKSDGYSEVHDCSLSVAWLNVCGEPIEKLFLWGHSACVIDKGSTKKVLVHGGFGGMGRHARRNDSLLLDPLDGTVEAIDTAGAPSPRMGHTASLIGEQMFVIGGRADPTSILSEIWALNTATNQWTLLNCNGDSFPPRHRHAAAVLGSRIYVFGGLNNDTIFSSIFVLDEKDLRWEELKVGGEQPCARHSHSMVAFGSQIFMFGGYNGEKALGDLYSFNVKTRVWRKEKALGRSPYARFSHSMFVYKHCLGIIGGCPVKQHFQELSLLDMHSQSWKHFSLNSVGKELFVRSTVSVVGDDLVIVGGGASCYAFGTKFSEPMNIALHTLAASNQFPFNCQQVQQLENPQNLGEALGSSSEDGKGLSETWKSASNWYLQFERKHAKPGKDLLKKFGWLDHGRKVCSSSNGTRICFPVTEKLYILFHEKGRVDPSIDTSHGSESNIVELPPLKESVGQGISLNEISSSKALNLLKQCGGTILAYETAEFRKSVRSPSIVIKQAAASLIKQKGLPEKLLEQLPSRWERLGDIVVLPGTSFKDPLWDTIGGELWPIIAKALNTNRLARQGCVAPTGTRDSTLKMLVGDNGWVDHRENGILYSFDATKCMFSWGNLSEKLRMARLDCGDEIIVDLFAGIGYFTLSFLVRAKAKLVYACEWNPHAIEALHHNLKANSVADRCIVLEGDNRITAPKGVADRVCLGLLPSSEGSWVTAVRVLRKEGGMLHVHGNVKDSDENTWVEHVANSIHSIATSEGRCWEVTIGHVERVKWYAPHIRHLVADVRCKGNQR
ncbi:hypothetical protein CDL15_Pgr012929 [Punica granatum]|uniref:SAM-dependent methyltransferase TRM5/TYW2-type domain-containing protein n=1 Tax=Punica granatum TaxID=22663 RepID=A0A218XF84_PUNGR|nr:hypothetical protein CDL15_Pgr012929 [Punica granatum]